MNIWKKHKPLLFSLLIFVLCLGKGHIALSSIALKKIDVSSGKPTWSSRSHQQKRAKWQAKAGLFRSELQKLEQELGQKNKEYARQLEQIQVLDEEISKLAEGLNQSSLDIKQKQAAMKKIMAGLAVSVLEENGSLEKVVQKEAMKKMAEKNLLEMNEQLKRNDDLQKEVATLKNRLFEYTEMANQLATVLASLEEKKKNWQVKPTAVQLVPSNLGPLKGRLRFPLTQFSSVERENKGASFKVRGKRAVYAVGKGKVVYSGALATYGNIIMIDHGQNIRSLVLGDLNPQVAKDKMVEEGDLLAMTNEQSNKDQQVYFEIRYQNVAQDISKWFKNKI